MTKNSHLATDFVRLRRAWKRSAILAGLAAFAVEALGLLAALVVVNALFDLHAIGRSLLVVAFGVVLLYHFWRGAVTPLLRRITDEQIALYVEEQCPEFEGALLAAAEFSGRADAATPQGRIILAILTEAEARLGRVDLRKAIHLGRLKKYAGLCLALLAAYGLAGAIFPEPVKQTLFTAVNPFYVKPVKQEAAAGPAEVPPLVIALTRNDQPLPEEIRLTRGGSLRIETHLNREPLAGKEELQFYFRPRTTVPAAVAPAMQAAASAAVPAAAAAPAKSAEHPEKEAVSPDGWRALKCAPIEETHAFATELPDITEDLEFYVMAGATRSPAYRVKTIDPLVVNEIHLTLQYPEYLQMAALAEVRPTADIAAVTGTTAILRIKTNNPVRTGTLVWADGTTSEIRPDPADARTMSVSVPVEKDGSFTYALRDVDDQLCESPVPALVRALPDLPPQIKMKQPVVDVAVHPLGEVTIEAELSDDWALRGGELVYLVGNTGTSQNIRQPLSLTAESPKKDGAEAGKAPVEQTAPVKNTVVRCKFRLETLQPRVKPGDLITYHLEGTDRKGQSISTDVYFIYVTPYETWMSWNPLLPMMQTPGVEVVIAPLEKFVAAAWHLKQEKSRLSPEEYQKRCEELAKKFEQEKDGKKGLINFLEAGE